MDNGRLDYLLDINCWKDKLQFYIIFDFIANNVATNYPKRIKEKDKTEHFSVPLTTWTYVSSYDSAINSHYMKIKQSLAEYTI